uniref:Putative tick transposon n=1 Tax=Rhipicephalus microplus TaxID=6941 RepID=A0A6G5AA22_RHIMP
MSFASCHSKLVKNGIITNCFRSALVKSCFHTVHASFHEQVSRLQDEGYPFSVMLAVGTRLLKKLRRETAPCLETGGMTGSSSKVVAVPYVHRLSHRLKKVAGKYDVKVVFSAKNKIGGVCALVNQKCDRGTNAHKRCSIRHKLRFVECAHSVVYCIPLSCGCVYIGQTGRCINTRLREHMSSLKGRPVTHLAMHCNECACSPCFSDTTLLYRSRNKTSREIMEAYHIDKQKDNCVSHPSVALLTKEIALLSVNQ